jgi:predicted methyltransferase
VKDSRIGELLWKEWTGDGYEQLNDESIDSSLRYYHSKLKPKCSYQVVFTNKKSGKKYNKTTNFYTPDQSVILSEAKDTGFNMLAQYNLMANNKPYQFLYILYKPSN